MMEFDFDKHDLIFVSKTVERQNEIGCEGREKEITVCAVWPIAIHS